MKKSFLKYTCILWTGILKRPFHNYRLQIDTLIVLVNVCENISELEKSSLAKQRRVLRLN